MGCTNSIGGEIVKFESGKRIRIGHVLGEGAFSFVYMGSSGNEKYAIKKVFIQSSTFERSVRAEIDAFKRFRHANILEMVDVVEHDNMGRGTVVYMLFPLAKSGNLRELLNNNLNGTSKRPNLKSILSDYRDICCALNLLHTFTPSYIHQDIKPENILISNGKPLLTDFGSVRQASIYIETRAEALALAEEAAQFCTVSYRAPELFDPPRGCKLDTRTDVWSLGCLLFAWYYGYSPFECEFNDNGTLRVVECTHLRVLNKIPTPIKKTAEDLSILTLCEDILKQDMSSRMFTADIITRLEAVMFTSDDV
eukprot:gene1931-3746_t